MKEAIGALLKKQSDWQKMRKTQPWGEKCRQAVVLRKTGIMMREGREQWPRRSN
ncbi:MAG TPA: hypothetical protein PKE26_09740 [Kiritimatiellia bacterium]|nr:hypothetical protein [Kiritimatiellia bacterium]HMO99378.1 hypothetical protein [Kiritimatiellia bacterium]